MDSKLQEYLTEDMLELAVEGDFDRVIDIVRYVPQTVKVENVYAYSSQLNKKTEFHLRVLIKALLEELYKMKSKGVDVEIDEGIIGMIKTETLNIDSADDILKLYRSNPKVVEVPKVIEKVVDNLVRLPEKYTTNQVTATCHPINKVSVAKDEYAVTKRHEVPVPIVEQRAVTKTDYVEKAVLMKTVEEVPFTNLIERTNIESIDRHIDKICEVEKAVMVPGQERIVIQKEIQLVNQPVQEVRYVENVVEKIKEVERIVEKIVEKVVEKEVIKPVTVYRDKIVKETVYEVIK